MATRRQTTARSTLRVFWRMGGWVTIGLWMITFGLGILRILRDEPLYASYVILPGICACISLWYVGELTVQGILARKFGRETTAYVTEVPQEQFQDWKPAFDKIRFQTVDYEAGRSGYINMKAFETFHIGYALPV